MRVEFESQKCIPLSQTVNLNSLTHKFSQNSNSFKQSYLMSLTGKPKDNDFILDSIQARKK